MLYGYMASVRWSGSFVSMEKGEEKVSHFSIIRQGPSSISLPFKGSVGSLLTGNNWKLMMPFRGDYSFFYYRSLLKYCRVNVHKLTLRTPYRMATSLIKFKAHYITSHIRSTGVL